MNVPAIFVPAGAMLKGRWRQHTLGTGSSTWAAEADYRAGKITQREWMQMSDASARSTGTCNTMGTASTMATLIDVLGLSLPSASTIPALDAEHGRMASDSGRRIVEMVWEDLKPSDIVTAAALKNAVLADMAVSGAANSSIHLVATPRGAVLKRSAADARLLDHVGPAVVFKDHHDLVARIDDPNLNVTPDSVLVLQEAGPIGAPGMPEWGMLPIPKKLLEAGVRDMVRISDARMSGTSYGTCVLHVCPESHVGGPLGLVKDGDLIRLDAAARRLDLLVDEAEMAARRRAWKAPAPHYER